MGSSNSKKLYNNVPFPTNVGLVHVFRDIKHYGCGPSAIPHVPARPTLKEPVDGLGRLRAHWPVTYAGIVQTPMKADFLFGIMCTNTDKLNENLQKGWLGFCIINDDCVLTLLDGSFKTANAQAPTKQSPTKNAFTEMAESLPDSPNRLNAAQLEEVTMRLQHAYLDYGVGFLIIEQDKFTYQVLVPNAQEYARNKEYYDERQAATKPRTVEFAQFRAEAQKAREEAEHARSKQTRSGKSYDGNAVTKKRKQD